LKGELDPLNKRLTIQPKPDMVVQVCVLAENKDIQNYLFHDHNLSIQTVDEVHPVQIYPAKALSFLVGFQLLGLGVCSLNRPSQIG
jgi:hypothetical protein